MAAISYSVCNTLHERVSQSIYLVPLYVLQECPLNRAKDGPDPSANKPLNKLLKIKLGGAKLGIESLNKGKHGNPQPTALVPLTNKKKALGINGSTGVVRAVFCEAKNKFSVYTEALRFVEMF